MKNPQTGSWKSVTSFALGMIGLVTWFFPYLSVPLTATGLLLGILGIRGHAKRNTAIAGVILCGISLLLTAAIAIYFFFFSGAAGGK
jgi:hypothetical protein